MNERTESPSLRDILNLAPDGRRIHHWRGQDLKEDTAALANTIVAALGLYNDNGRLVQLDPRTGALTHINLAAFQQLVDKHVCGERLVNRGTGDKPKWGPEYFTFRFDQPWRPDATAAGPRLQPDENLAQPDAKVLDELYRHRVAELLPRVVS